MPRVGLEKIQQVLLEDSEGIVADLDAGIQRSIDAYTDPWGQDAKEPATPGQFRPSLPLIALQGARPMSLTDLTETTTVAPSGPKAQTVGMVDDVPVGEGRTFVVAGEQVAVFRLRDGSLHATQAACPHAGGPLAERADGRQRARLPAAPVRLPVVRRRLDERRQPDPDLPGPRARRLPRRRGIAPGSGLDATDQVVTRLAKPV